MSSADNSPRSMYGLASEILRTQGLNALLLACMIVGGGWGLWNIGNRVTDGLLMFLNQQTTIAAEMLNIERQSLVFMERVTTEHRDQMQLMEMATDNQRAIIANQEQMIQLQKQTLECLEKRGPADS